MASFLLECRCISRQMACVVLVIIPDLVCLLKLEHAILIGKAEFTEESVNGCVDGGIYGDD
jgi:hypothetical protein